MRSTTADAAVRQGEPHTMPVRQPSGPVRHAEPAPSLRRLRAACAALMLARHVVLGAVIAVLAPTTVQAQAQADVAFDWFDYRGDDAVFVTPLPAGHYRNPVLAGFYLIPA